MKTINPIVSQYKQKGVAAVEFAIIAVILFTLLFGIMEMGRVLFMMNTAAEATRLGARLAVVCDKDAPIIKTKPADLAGFLEPGHIDVKYNSGVPAGCTSGNICSVTVSIIGLTVTSIVPLIPFDFPMPSFSTTLPRESMDSAGGTNPVCI